MDLLLKIYYQIRCNMVILTIHPRDHLTSLVYPHHCHQPRGTSVSNHILSAADNHQLQATCQFWYVTALNHWRIPHNSSRLVVWIHDNTSHHSKNTNLPDGWQTELHELRVFWINNGASVDWKNKKTSKLKFQNPIIMLSISQSFCCSNFNASPVVLSIMITLIDPCDQLDGVITVLQRCSEM